MTTFTIMRVLPREVDPTVYEMLHEDPGDVSFSSVGGLNEQIRELREVIELPLTQPELFKRVGIKPPKVRAHAHARTPARDCLACAQPARERARGSARVCQPTTDVYARQMLACTRPPQPAAVQHTPYIRAHRSR